MADQIEFVGKSTNGRFSEALQAAITAASRDLNADFFAWRLKEIAGTVGGIVGAHDIRVTITTGSTGAVSAKTETAARSGDWHAWRDRMPGKPPTLHVVGTCECPTAGYTASLRPVSPQGVNPAIYILELVLTPPDRPAAQVITGVPVYYREITATRYGEVFIIPDNTLVPVLEVS
jgi:hypothetical protein